MKRELDKLIPLGTAMPNARQIMERFGYRVTGQTNASFSEDGRVRSGIDYLYCDCSEFAGLLVHRRWQVAIVHTNGTVSGILVSMGLVGL